MVFRVVICDGDMFPSIFQQTQHIGQHRVPGGSRAALDQERVYMKTLHLATDLCSTLHKQEDLILAVRKFL